LHDINGRMQQPPDANNQIDVELHLSEVETVRRIDLDDRRADLRRAKLGAPQEANQVEDQLRM
jgi:hypothetical protein